MTSKSSQRAIESEYKNISSNGDIVLNSLSNLDLTEAKEASGRIKKSAFNIVKIFCLDGLNAIEDYVESIFQGSTIVLIKEENYQLAEAALCSASCKFEFLPPLDYDEAVAQLNAMRLEHEALQVALANKVEAIENFNVDEWREEVALTLEESSATARNKLAPLMNQVYEVIHQVTGLRFVWNRDDSDTVFSQAKKHERRRIINLAFKCVIPLVNEHLIQMKLGADREASLLALLDKVFLSTNDSEVA